MAQGRADPRRRRLQCRDARHHADGDAVPVGPSLPLQKLEDQRRHGVDARVAGAGQGHGTPPGRQLQGGPDPRLLLAQLVAVSRPALRQRPEQVEIEPVADQVARAAHRRLGLRRAPGGIARADADHRQAAARPAGLEDRSRRAGDGDGGPRRLGLGHDQRARRAGRRQGRALGDAMAADLAEHQVRGIGQARRLGLEGLSIKEAGRHAQVFSQRLNRRLVGLDVDRIDARHGPLGQVLRRQGLARQGDDLLRRRAPLAADPQGQDGGMVDQPVHGPRIDPIGRAKCQRARRTDRQVALREPRGLALQAHPRSREKTSREVFVMLRVTQFPTRRRRIQSDTETAVAGRGDGRAHIQDLADAVRQVVGAPVSAQQRHHRRAVLGQGQDRRLRMLVVEKGRQGPHQDAGGADSHHRPPGGEEAAQVLGGPVESHVCIVGAPGQAMNLGARQRGRQAPSQVEAARCQGDKCNGLAHVQASPRRCTRIMEK